MREIAERGIARAEIVERDPHAERAQRDEAGDDMVGIVDQRALGDLDREAAAARCRSS
jgi:hypothetical protein